MKKIINLRGCTGSGKTTFIKQLLENDKEHKQIVYSITKGKNKNNKNYITISEKYNTIIIGKYDIKTGGLDYYNNMDEMLFIIELIIKDFPDYNIMFEGMIFSSSVNKVNYLIEKYNNYNFKIIFVDIDEDEAIERLVNRSNNIKDIEKTKKAQISTTKSIMNQITKIVNPNTNNIVEVYRIINYGLTKHEFFCAINKFVDIKEFSCIPIRTEQ